MLTKAEARKIMLSVKGVHEGPYFGRPSTFYGESFVGRVHDREDAVALRVGTMEMRDVMLEAEPKLFYITDHYRPWPMLLARLDRLDTKTLKELVAARMTEIDAKAAKKQPRKKKTVKPPGRRNADQAEGTPGKKRAAKPVKKKKKKV